MDQLILIILGLIAAAGISIMAAVWLFRFPRAMLAVYLLLIPFHSMAVNVLRVDFGLGGPVLLIFQAWKDVLLLLMVAWVFWKIAETGKVNLGLNHFSFIILVLAFVGVGTFGLIKSPSLLIGLYAWRGTYEPYMLLIVALMLPLNIEWLKKLLPAVIVVGMLVTIFAIIQVLFLGFPFVWKYFAVNGSIPSSFIFSNGSFQRAMGTFSSPNTFSLYLAFLIIILINLLLRKKFPIVPGWGLLGLFMLGLVITVSRSGWLAAVAGAGFSFLIWKRKQRIALILASLGLLGVMAGMGLGLGDWLIHTISGREISANYHLDMLVENVQVITENPFGVGLGRAGARGLRFLDSLGGDYYLTESYLLQLGMETGIPGLILFITLVLLAAIFMMNNIYLLRTPFGRAWTIIGISSLLAAVVHSILIPDLQDLTLSSYLWFIVGIALRMPVLEKSDQHV